MLIQFCLRVLWVALQGAGSGFTDRTGMASNYSVVITTGDEYTAELYARGPFSFPSPPVRTRGLRSYA